MSLVEIISRLQSSIHSCRDRQSRLTEADTIRVLILPLLRALGWNLEDLDETRSEYRHQPSDNPVDVALFLQRSPALFVEAKALGVDLDDRKWITQTLNYANIVNVDWCVLTNGAEWRVYKVHAPVEAEEKLFFTVRLDGDAPVEDLAAKLELISRERMRVRDIDGLWQEQRIDGLMKQALNDLAGDDTFLRLLVRKTGLRISDVRDSLRRGNLRADYPEAGPRPAAAVFAPVRASKLVPADPVPPEQSAAPGTAVIGQEATVEAAAASRKLRTGEMFE
ncbi:type I restriction enzyme HsdR N-terminal domain-containing protein [Cereibacter sphaeroides]|nr:type I restriction enzyme HsdR N-terminal domain-containing protein [Cereibacter sphaeroides]